MALIDKAKLRAIFDLWAPMSLGADLIGIPSAIGAEAWNKTHPRNKKSVKAAYWAGTLSGAAGGYVMRNRMGPLMKSLANASLGAEIGGLAFMGGAFIYNRIHPDNKKSLIKSNIAGTVAGAAGGVIAGSILSSKMANGIRF